MPVLSPFPYYGGKIRMLPFILDRMPVGRGFIDLFGGSGVVSLAVQDRFKHIIYNDIDDRIYNFFKVLRDDGDALVSVVRMTPVSRTEFDKCYEKSDDPVEDARRVFVRINQSFSQTGLWQKSSGWRAPTTKHTTSLVPPFHNRTEMLHEIAERFRNMLIENRDWRKVIGYSRHDSVIFADPPYDLSVRRGKTYGNEMTDQDHIDLAEALSGCPATAVVCGYHSALYDDLYSDWELHEREYRCHTARNKESGTMRTECLWIKNTQDCRPLVDKSAQL